MILVLNCGSSSLKFCLFDERERRALAAWSSVWDSANSLVCERNGEQRIDLYPLRITAEH